MVETAETAETGETGDTSDSSVDSGETGCASTWYPDADGDGHGDPAEALIACDAPEGYVASGEDCGPADATVYPRAPERCDEQQNDCATPWTDADEDGLALWTDSGGATDLSATLAAGTAHAPADLVLTTDGTLDLCRGEWYIRVTLLPPAAAVELRGAYGRDDTAIVGGASGGAALVRSQGVALSLSGLSLRDGQAPEGGAILGSGAAILVESSRLEGNAADGDGGGIHLAGADLTLDDVELEENTAGDDGGAVWLSDGSLTDAGSSWTRNLATDHGGGFYGEDLYGATFDGVTATANVAGDDGGWACAFGTGTVSVESSLIEANEAVDAGGGLRVDADLYVSECTFLDNLAANGAGIRYSPPSGTIVAEVRGTRFEGNEADYGGGFYLGASGSGSSADVTLDTVEFVGNVATEWGGGMYLTLDLQTPTGGVSLLSVLAEGNAAGTYGGGMLVSHGGKEGLEVPLSLSSVTVQDNILTTSDTAHGAGAYLLNAGGPLTVEDSTFDGNRGDSATTAEGLGLVVYGSEVTVTRTTVSGNGSYAEDALGAGLCGWIDGGTLALDEVEVEANEGPALAGAYVGAARGNALSVLGSRFLDHEGSGLLVDVSPERVAIDGSLFEGNGEHGLAIDSDGSALTLTLGGTLTDRYGALANAGAGLYLTWSEGTDPPTVTATEWDLGVGGTSDDNGGGDVVLGASTWSWEDDASFTCLGESCS